MDGGAATIDTLKFEAQVVRLVCAARTRALHICPIDGITHGVIITTQKLSKPFKAKLSCK